MLPPIHPTKSRGYIKRVSGARRKMHNPSKKHKTITTIIEHTFPFHRPFHTHAHNKQRDHHHLNQHRDHRPAHRDQPERQIHRRAHHHRPPRAVEQRRVVAHRDARRARVRLVDVRRVVRGGRLRVGALDGDGLDERVEVAGGGVVGVVPVDFAWGEGLVSM